MLSSTDHDKLQQIMQEHPETEELFNRIFKSHHMDISTISHEIRNPLTLVYSTLQLIESQHPEVLEFAHWSELHQDILEVSDCAFQKRKVIVSKLKKT